MAYKLFYFNFKALGEPIRFLLSYGKVQFEDIRYSFEEWPKHKDYMPMGQMPVLEIDGKKMYQTISICRYLGRKFGLGGKTEMEDYEIDKIVEVVNDLRTNLGAIHYEKDEKIQAEKRKAGEESLAFYLKKLDEAAKENNGHLALKRLTWADLYFTALTDYLNFMAKFDVMEKQANLKKVFENVMKIDTIKKWVETRPVTEV